MLLIKIDKGSTCSLYVSNGNLNILHLAPDLCCYYLIIPYFPTLAIASLYISLFIQPYSLLRFYLPLFCGSVWDPEKKCLKKP